MLDTLITLAAALFWIAVLKLIPIERWLTSFFVAAPSRTIQRVSFWSLVAIGSLATTLIGNWLLPTSGHQNAIGNIKDNSGIITQGQTGDNTISK
jgi:hypothetical protein